MSSPEEIAKILFTKDALEPNSCLILAGSDNNDICTEFEILLTILFEGFNILTQGIEKINQNNINANHFNNLNPWFNSIGYKINAEVVDKLDEESYNKYYSKSIINDNSYKYFFDSKKIKKPYHFFLSINTPKGFKELDELYNIYICNNKVFKIKFKHMNQT